MNSLTFWQIPFLLSHWELNKKDYSHVCRLNKQLQPGDVKPSLALRLEMGEKAAH